MIVKGSVSDSAVLLGLAVLFAVAFHIFWSAMPIFFPVRYELTRQVSVKTVEEPVEFRPTHIGTPYPVKAIYMTQCVAGDEGLRQKLVDIIDTTELNSVVMDIKDYSGRIAYPSKVEIFTDALSPICRARDMAEFIDYLHKKGIYVIGRITVFQDPFLVGKRPDLAIKKMSDSSIVWKDRKGISYIDPGAKDAWNSILSLSTEAYEKIGFDEINLDYIRFPSDGDMNDIYYPFSDSVISADPKKGKASVMKEFFAYVSRDLKKKFIPLSGDVFGMTTTNADDLNIGQILEDILPYFDYVAPMVYPSHYPPNFIGFSNPATKPYEVVKYSMDSAFLRASTTPWKLRPWLQDFSLGATYTPEMVRAQIDAVYDSGLESWMLWNAGNKYTVGALNKE